MIGMIMYGWGAHVCIPVRAHAHAHMAVTHMKMIVYIQRTLIT